MFQAFAFSLLIFWLYYSKSSNGFSLHSVITYFFSYLFEVILILIDSKYFLFKLSIISRYSRNNTEYLLSVIASTILTLIIIFTLVNNNYNSPHDTIKAYYTIPFGLIVSIGLRIKVKTNFINETIWLYYHFLRAIGILPQLMLFIKKVTLI